MEKSVLEMTDVEILEHVRGLIKRRDEQVVEKAVKKVQENQVSIVKKRLKSVDNPVMKELLDFFNEEKGKK
jgi:N-methylhydantoinase B/oxoprolinase/acetone carboxylase alpha subunit